MAHPALVDDHFDVILEKVAAGKSIGGALRGLAINPALFYRRLQANPEMAQRYNDVLAERRFTKGEEVDELVERRAKRLDAPPQLVLAYAKRWNDAYREKSTVEHVGGQTVKHMHIDLTEVAKIMAEAGVVVEHDGPAAELSGPELLPAHADS